MNKNFIDQVFEVVKRGHDMGISHQTLDNTYFNGNSMSFENGDPFVNFSLCDYLALSTDDRIKEGAIESIRKNGVYTAVSRTYMKLNAYKEAEEMVTKIFNKPTLITPRTTLAHISAIPVLIERNDAMILDHQVHTSVRLATEIVRAGGVHTEILRHNNMNRLEDRIKVLSEKHNKIWYFADGVYSMYGDTLPFEEIKALMNKYPQLYCYVDDAHGMSWRGENGKGLFLENTEYHPQFFLTTSLGKGFGAGGGAIICPDEEIKERIAFTAAPLMFTSPVEPATLGSIMASTKIHLSNEINERQKALQKNIKLFYSLSKELKIPVLSNRETPIFFIATGPTHLAGEIIVPMLHHGYHLTSGVYPAVPMNNSGIRGIINLHQTPEDITKMLHLIRDEYNATMERNNTSVEEILRHYKI